MDRNLYNLALWFRPARFHLGNEETIRLSRLLGYGSEKLVFKISGRQEAIKVRRKKAKSFQNSILQEIQHEQAFKKTGIDFARLHRFDPQGRWLIREYIPEPTIRQFLKANSETLYCQPLLDALTELLQKLGRARKMMDMNPANWVLRFKERRPILLSLEPILDFSVQNGWPSFENVFLPLWLGHHPPFRMKNKQWINWQRRWKIEPRYCLWRKYFGENFPELHHPWKIY